MPEKQYLRRLENIYDFEVWEVDGQYIRNNINREFTNFGQHFRFPFIPMHEFWIDKEYGSKETQFFVDHMIVEWNLMHSGSTYDQAITKADAVELKERKKSEAMQKAAGELHKHHSKVVPHEIYTEKIAENAGVQVWVVNGELVRDLYFIDLTEGGHHFVYNFVPYNEVWIDDDLNPNERYYVLLHELHERYLMYTGLTYPHAHHSASIIEYKCRHKPNLLEACLTEEVAKNANCIKDGQK